MSRQLRLGAVAAICLGGGAAWAQTGDGSLRGYAKDEQGGALPGVTVTATSPSLITPVSALTDPTGYYRLLNLPPGTYALKSELSGFSTYRREGLVMRAGSTFSLDVVMKIGNMEEVITVTGDSPIIETSKPTSAFNVDGDLLRAVPVTSRRLWSDFVDMVPGVGSRNIDDGSGRRAYYSHGGDIFSNNFQIEGAPVGGYADFSAQQINMSGDLVADIQVKVAGNDASTPLGTGVVADIVTQRGGNAFKGSVGYALQPLSWNADNTQSGRVGGGVPTLQQVNQLDASVGGPLRKDKVWFFAAFRYADLVNGISRTATDLERLQAFRPDYQPFNNEARSYQPYLKLTGQLSPRHEFSAYYQYDRVRFTNDREQDTHHVGNNSSGGSLVGAKLTSIWSNRLSSQISAGWNDKGGANTDTYKDATGFGPEVQVFQTATLSQGVLVGSGQLAEMNNVQTTNLNPSSVLVIRGDLTYYTESWLGSHELKTGIYAAPQNRYDITTQHVNDGFILEDVRLKDPNNLAGGVVPFRRRFRTPASVKTTAARDRDIGLYVQDLWKPHRRLTASLGVRVDFIRRHDDIFDIDRMKSVEVGPRVGLSWMLTGDARTVLRASYGRVHEQVGGRDSITTFGGATGTGRFHTRDVYDLNGDGIFETERITLPASANLADREFDPDLHQPFVDEFVLGIRKQLPGQLSVDLSGIRRYYQHTYALVDINGFYPDGPGKAFGGFGRVDPNRGIFEQQTNNTWSQSVITDLELVVAKNLPNLQLMLSATRQWQHLDGTWNPTDPARFIQPDAFPNDRDIPLTRGNNERNTLDGGGRPIGAAWRPFSIRLVGTYHAPWNLVLGGSYIVSAGDYSGPIVRRLSANDPQVTQFGPANIRLANGNTAANPLATTWRFVNATRGEGQIRNETVKYLQLKLGREFTFADQRLEVALNVFNVFNEGHHQQYAAGANQSGTANYLRPFSRQPPRAVQLTFVSRF